MKPTLKRIGFLVIDKCEVHEQPLGLDLSPDKPIGGILEWTDGPRAVFETRAEAVKAINRTEHYRLAFNSSPSYPEKKFCEIIPLAVVGHNGDVKSDS